MGSPAANPYSSYWQPVAGTKFDFTKQFNTDAYKYLPTSSLGAELAVALPPVEAALPPVEAALPSVDPAVKAATDFYKSVYPLQRQQLLDTAQIQSALTQQELAATYPWLSQAAAESTARNLAASQAYRSFAEGLPSNVQNIMASKQAQMASAASSEAERARAMAAQSDAAKRFAGSYAGKYVSYS